jgi:adenylate cyclase class 2
METTLEREIKLPFAHAARAREAIARCGATPLRGRRLQEDCLLDNAQELLRNRRSVLRVRMEIGRSLLTYKGPVQPSPMKLRDERETVVADGETMMYILEQLGFHPWFRYQKYREEFGCENATIAIDETPIGTFVEIEGGEAAINTVAAALGCTPDDYLVDSYRGLYVKHCQEKGIPVGDMVFEE